MTRPSSLLRTHPTPKDPACPSRDSGWLVTRQPSFGASLVATICQRTHAAAIIPVESLGAYLAHFPSDGSLPRLSGGSAFHINIFGACSTIHCTLQPAGSRSHLHDPFGQRLQLLRYLHDCSDCYRLERQCGPISHWVIAPFHGAQTDLFYQFSTPPPLHSRAPKVTQRCVQAVAISAIRRPSWSDCGSMKPSKNEASCLYPSRGRTCATY